MRIFQARRVGGFSCRRVGSFGARRVGGFGAVLLGFGSGRLSSSQPRRVFAPETRGVAAPAPRRPRRPAEEEDNPSNIHPFLTSPNFTLPLAKSDETNLEWGESEPLRWWSRGELIPFRCVELPPRSLSALAFCSSYKQQRLPSFSTIYHLNQVVGEGEGLLRLSDLQPHFLQQLLSSLHPLSDQTLQLADRLGGSPAARLLFGWTAAKSRTKLWPNHRRSRKKKKKKDEFYFIFSLIFVVNILTEGS